MSLERAYVNCERCYLIGSSTKGTTLSEDAEKRAGSSSLWEARNEAMRALEATIAGSSDLEETAREGLKASMRCDFKTRYIVHIVERLRI